MKKQLTAIIISTMSLVVVNACHKKEPSYPMYATINGAPFKGTNCIARTFYGTLYIDGGFFSDSSVAPPFIELDVLHYNGAGTYSLQNNHIPYNNSNAAIIDSGINGGSGGVDGTLNITSTSPNIQGNFNFTTTNGTVVANGTFSAKAP